MNKLFLSLLLLVSFSAYADMSVNNGRIQPSKSNASGFKSDGRTYTSNSTQSTYLKSSNGARSNRPVNVTVQNQVAKRTVMSNVFRNAKSGIKSIGMATLRRSPKFIAYSLLAALCTKSKKCKEIVDDVRDFFDTENTEENYIIFLTNDPNGFLNSRVYTYKQFQAWCAEPASSLASSSDRNCKIVHVIPPSISNQIYALSNDACIGVARVKVGSLNNIKETNRKHMTNWCAYEDYKSDVGVQYARIRDNIPLTESRFIEIAKDEADEDPDSWVNASKDEDGKVPGMSKPIVIDVDVEIVISNPYTDPNDGKPKQTKWEFEKDEKGEVRVKETHEDRPDLEPNSPQAPKVKLDIDLEDDDKKEEQDKKQDNDEDDKPTEIEVELCEDGSDIIACQKLGEVDKDQFDALEVPKEEDNTAWSKEDLLPPTGVCPAPRSVNLHGYTISMEYTAICGVAERIRAVVLAVSMIAAGLMVVGSLRR